MSRQLTPQMCFEDVQDLMTDLQCHLSGGIKTCFHGKPILLDLYDLTQLPESQQSDSIVETNDFWNMFICAQMCVCVCVCMHWCVCLCICMFMHMFVYKYLVVYAQVCECVCKQNSGICMWFKIQHSALCHVINQLLENK